MLRKLYASVSGSCCPDNPDSPQHQEVLLPGYLYGMIIKERLEEALNNIRNLINTDVRRPDSSVDFIDSKYNTELYMMSLIHLLAYRAIY
jgi:DNA-directed RNA polymerase I subunit RPA2